VSPLSHTDRAARALVGRAEAFAVRVERELAIAGDKSAGTTHALELFLAYAQSLRLQIEREAASLPDRLLAGTIRALNNHFRARVALFDGRFGRSNYGFPPALSAAVERECRAWGLQTDEAVVTVGEPGNFTTFVGDLRTVLFRDLTTPAPNDPATTARRLVSIAVPEIEGLSAAWQPVTVGHELAHYLQHQVPVNAEAMVLAGLDAARLDAMVQRLPASVIAAPTQSRGFEQVAVRWLNEIFCDAYAVYRFGPAGVGAMAEFLDHVGSTSVVSGSHPPGSLRQWLLNHWLSPVEAWQHEVIGAFVRPAVSVSSSAPDWVVYLASVFVSLADEIWNRVTEWAQTPRYPWETRGSVVEEFAAQLDEGIPCSRITTDGLDATGIAAADVINACWLALARGSERPIDRLSLKALDTLDFLTLWTQAGGPLEMSGRDAPAVGDSPEPDRPSVAGSDSGVLTAPDLASRLDRTDARRLIVTPRLIREPSGASLDVRLGNGFIVFERTSAAAFDSLSSTQRPSSMQRFVQKSWGDVFYLHPGQLVLAATLEYIAVPCDLTAQVITRSSYGRLGLLSATAVQVHPDYYGCLTLELVNLGEMPLTLTPGERVAQLVFSAASQPVTPAAEAKYRYPTGPEFSKIMGDTESNVMRSIREAWRSRRL
jgi:deoxycytidine triphosphate deaminase